MLRAESVIAVSAKADPQMNVRLSPEDVAQLKRVGAIEPAVRGLGAAMRRLIHASMQPGGSVPVEATADVVADDDSRRAARIPAGVDDARALRDAVLQTRDDLRASVAGLESQARAQGHSLNQIAKACNKAARRGVSTDFDEHLIAALSDEWERLSLAVVELASVVDAQMPDLDRKTRR